MLGAKIRRMYAIEARERMSEAGYTKVAPIGARAIGELGCGKFATRSLSQLVVDLSVSDRVAALSYVRGSRVRGQPTDSSD